MKLYTFEIAGQRRLGAEWSGLLIDLAVAYDLYAAAQNTPPVPRVLPADLASFIRLGTLAIEAATRTIDYIKKRPAVPVGAQVSYPLEAVNILAPHRPGKIVCARGGSFFPKLPNTIAGPGEPVSIPKGVSQIEVRPSLTAVIGRRVKGNVENAIAGYTLLCDVSLAGGEFLNGNHDSFCPIGPCVVTTDEFKEGAAIEISINGGAVQQISIGDCEAAIRSLAEVMTLEPGDIVSASTLSLNLQPGDLMTATLPPLGRLEISFISAA